MEVSADASNPLVSAKVRLEELVHGEIAYISEDLQRSEATFQMLGFITISVATGDLLRFIFTPRRKFISFMLIMQRCTPMPKVHDMIISQSHQYLIYDILRYKVILLPNLFSVMSSKLHKSSFTNNKLIYQRAFSSVRDE